MPAQPNCCSLYLVVGAKHVEMRAWGGHIREAQGEERSLMSHELDGKTIVFLAAASGVEQIELVTPWEAVTAAGGTPVLVSDVPGEMQAFHHDTEPGDTFPIDKTVQEIPVERCAALVLPGGTTNPDKLRLSPEAVEFVAAVVGAGKPVAAICHGPWMLVEADVLAGKTLTSWPSLRTDIRNAGGTWIDEPVHVCIEHGWPLVTSRRPDDLPAFVTAMVTAFT
ncbi:type 1 glutamine amidotransferase domain-containing protein [Arthrobacter sp. STN4]|uniref:type 1 glutamine amidotransferase domain-containing protein n=1 Tax=Arthrobacter sp. STN4 TaxID=2923276 RepID=UPI0028113D4D|nr:type 1 glutamine amidotransferase domain-containing protein [Arthrobacter sp. STN4]